ncbi:MAG: site-specific DNA-methyltransferase [Pirellulales bacterium]
MHSTAKAKSTQPINEFLPQGEIDEIESRARRQGYSTAAEYLLDLHRQATEADPAIEMPPKQATKPQVAFKTDLGKIILGDSCAYLTNNVKDESVDLIMTSPPFGLVRKKAYGNEDADQYVQWFRKFGREFARVLKPTGSLVIDIGGAWKPGTPTRSLYHYELLIMLCRMCGFHLAQEFFWWNPAKLPTPAEWVNVRRVRVKDAVNCIWWLSKTPFPKVSNRRILQPYSESMKDLLKNGYKAKVRPSGHDISTKFQRDNGGAIPPNLIAIANTESNGAYQRYCREHGIPEHPARFPAALPAMFIRMLTDKDDFVIDPFGGSCVTGAVADQMGRRWTCCELDSEYVEGAKGRFLSGAEVVDSLQFGRSAPYEIFPPALLLDEENCPLVEDGGRERPKLNKS